MEKSECQGRYDSFVEVFKDANPEMKTSVQYAEAQKLWNKVNCKGSL